MVEVGTTSFRIIRYGVVAQMPHDANLRLTEHLTFPQNTPAMLRPVREFAYALSKLLPAGAPFHLEASLLRLPAIMREA